MEIFCKEGAPYSHIYLSLPTPGERDSLYAKLLEQEGTPNIPKSFLYTNWTGSEIYIGLHAFNFTELQLEQSSKDDMMIKWQSKNLSNFDYLMFLNRLYTTSVDMAVIYSSVYSAL